MLQKMSRFLRPNKMILILFLLLVIFAPVLYVYTEPERTNYLPGEKQAWLTKTKIYPNIFREYVFHTEGDIDILLGIIQRNYFSNEIGIILLALYYLLAAGMYRLFCSVLSGFDKPVGKNSREFDLKGRSTMQED
jgi:hypothetical protein